MVGSILRWPLFQTLIRARRTTLWSELKPLLRSRLLSILSVPGPSAALVSKWPAKDQVNQQPHSLFQMATGYWLSQAVYVAAKIGVADLLMDGPESCSVLAAKMGVDRHSLFRLMRALSGAGVFAQLEGDRFALTRLGEGLRSHAPGSLRQLVITLGEIHYQAWGSLLHSVRTGLPAFNHVFGPRLFEYLQWHAEAATSFNEGMTDISSMLAYAVLMAYDFSGIRSLVDVGGGHGRFLRNILEFHPEIEGVVFDLPSTIATTKEFPSDPAPNGRCLLVAGDFLKDVPLGFDAHILCGILHDWDDAHSILILKNCRRAMAKNGRVLLVEMVVPAGDAHCFSQLLDLNMLVMTGGRERTKAEFCALFDAAGFKLTKIVPTMAPQSVIEAVPK